MQSPLNEISDLSSDNSNNSILSCISPSSTTSFDRDNMSLPSTSSESNSSSSSNRSSSSATELQQHQSLFTYEQKITQQYEQLSNIQINEIDRRRYYRAGLCIFNKYVLFKYYAVFKMFL